MSGTNARRAPRAQPEQQDDPEQPAGEAPRWWTFTGAYPVVLMAAGQLVEPGGDPVEWPDGPPDTENWQPAQPPPAPEES